MKIFFIFNIIFLICFFQISLTVSSDLINLEITDINNNSNLTNNDDNSKQNCEICNESELKSSYKNQNLTIEEQNNNAKIRYNGAQVWRILINDEEEHKKVDELKNKYGGQTWMAIDNEIDILLTQNSLYDAENLLKELNLTHVILIDDLQKIIELENPSKDEIEILQNRKGHRMTWQAYHRMSDIHSYLDYLAKTYPDLCSVQIIGYSIQRQPLKLIRISNGKQNNKAIWIDGGIHAREWISPATVTYIINEITENWEDLPNYMRNVDWYILPLANPDGYEYTHQTDRLWRKNRNIGNNYQCIGVDLNRNFGYKWGGQGSSKNPCTEIFGGSRAFSEPESLAIKNFLSKYGGNKFKSYMSFHSYGQYILHPWGYDKSVPSDYKDLDRVGKEAAASMLRIGGARYRVGPSGSLLYPASGGSDDWAKGELGIKYSYTVEMRDMGRYGFILPAHMIGNTAKEGYVFAETVAKAVSKL